jgi:hypothetical protein
MRFFVRLRNSAKRHRQRFVAALVVVSLLCASLGLPTWIEPVKDLSQAFPCMHHRCGCASAEACWRGCCCMTAAEKLAWAEEHGVTPPAYAIAQAKAAPARACGGSCCQHDHVAASPESVDESASKLAHEQAAPAGSLALVLSSQYRHCQGLTAFWLMLGQALPPAEDASDAAFEHVAGEWLRVVSQPSAESRAISPAEPPPWSRADVA